MMKSTDARRHLRSVQLTTVPSSAFAKTNVTRRTLTYYDWYGGCLPRDAVHTYMLRLQHFAFHAQIASQPIHPCIGVRTFMLRILLRLKPCLTIPGKAFEAP